MRKGVGQSVSRDIQAHSGGHSHIPVRVLPPNMAWLWKNPRGHSHIARPGPPPLLRNTKVISNFHSHLCQEAPQRFLGQGALVPFVFRPLVIRALQRLSLPDPSLVHPLQDLLHLTPLIIIRSDRFELLHSVVSGERGRESPMGMHHPCQEVLSPPSHCQALQLDTKRDRLHRSNHTPPVE